jgi:hypothetical protein
MVLKGLDAYGEFDRAHAIGKKYLDAVVSVFGETDTLFENYSSGYKDGKAIKGNPAKGDFVGWSGIAPITVLFEYVFGIHPNAREEKIVWDVRLTEEHGVKNYPLGELSVNLICHERENENEEPIITAICEKPIEIEVRFGNKSKIITATQK